MVSGIGSTVTHTVEVTNFIIHTFHSRNTIRFSFPSTAVQKQRGTLNLLEFFTLCCVSTLLWGADYCGWWPNTPHPLSLYNILIHSGLTQDMCQTAGLDWLKFSGRAAQTCVPGAETLNTLASSAGPLVAPAGTIFYLDKPNIDQVHRWAFFNLYLQLEWTYLQMLSAAPDKYPGPQC